MVKRVFLGTIMVLSMISCIKDEISEPNTGVKTLSATVEGNSLTKVGFADRDGTGPVSFFWTEGDKIGVTTDAGNGPSNSFSLMSLDVTDEEKQIGAGCPNGSFTGDFSEEPSGYAVYPMHEKHSMIHTKAWLDYYLPSQYSYKELDSRYAVPDGNSHNAPMWGKIDENGSVSFKHLGGVIAFQVNNLPAKAVNMQFVLTASHKINGTFGVSLGESNPVLETETDRPEDECKVVVDFITAVNQTTGFFYIPVPTGYYKYFDAVVKQNGKEIYGYSWKDVTINRCDIRRAIMNIKNTGGEVSYTTTVESAKEVRGAMVDGARTVKVAKVSPDNDASDEATIVIPKKNLQEASFHHELFIMEIDNSTRSIIIMEEEDDANVDDKVRHIQNLMIQVPSSAEGKKLVIDMPNATVTLVRNSQNSVTLNYVETSTADNTLIIKGVKIEELIINKGSIRVSKEAEITKWESTSGAKGNIYVEGGKIPEGNAPEGYTIIGSLKDFLDNNPSGTYTLTKDEIVAPNTIIPKGVAIEGAYVDGEKYSITTDKVDDGKGKAVFILEGGTISNVAFESPDTQYDIIVKSGVSTIDNCDFITSTASEMGKGKRSIYAGSGVSGHLGVFNSVFDNGAYAFNFSEPNDLEVVFQKCQLGGWLSGYGRSHYFMNCTFKGSGNYQNYIPYCDTRFEKCIFEDDFTISLKHASNLMFYDCTRAEETIDEPSDLLWDFSGDGEDNGTSEMVTIGDKVWKNSATTVETVKWEESELPIASIIKNGVDKYYYSLQDAIKDVEEKETIVILRDVADAAGLVIDENKQVVIDFNEHTYTLNGPGVGSKGTETLGFQIMSGQVVFINGTINCSEDNKNRKWTETSSEKGIAMMIQNYADLVLDQMTIDGTNIAHNGNNVRYIVSNNSGKVVINSTSIIAPEGDIAFDVCKYGSYSAPFVYCSQCNIDGEIELSGGALEVSKGVMQLTKPIKVKSDAELILNDGCYIFPSKYWRGGDALIVVNRKGNLTLSGSGEISNNGNTNVYAAIKMTEKGEENTDGKASLVVEGPTLNGYYYGITGNGNRHNTSICIRRGVVSSSCENDGHAIYHPQNGELVIYDGEFIGYNSAVELRGGEMTVHYGYFQSMHDGETVAMQNGSGTSIIGAAIAVSPHNASSNVKLTILDGIFEGKTNHALYEAYTNTDAEISNAILSVSGGAFFGKVYSESCENFIHGGYYSDNPDEKYLAAGAQSDYDGDMYGVYMPESSAQ